MLGIERVVIAVDFSEGSSLALQRGAELAKHGQSALTLVHVREGVTDAGMKLSDDDMAMLLAKRTEDALRAEGVDVASVPLTYLVCSGKPVVELLRIAQEITADLIIVGYKGQSPSKRAQLGSVAGSVVRHADRPVLIARERKIQEPIRVMATVDLGDAAPEVIRTAADWVRVLKGELWVMNTWETSGQVEYSATGTIVSVRNPAQSVLDESRVRLAEKVEAVVGTAANATLVVKSGVAAYEVIATSAEHQIDLVVMGSHGRKGVMQVLLGNTAERVMSQTDASVLVIRV